MTGKVIFTEEGIQCLLAYLKQYPIPAKYSPVKKSWSPKNPRNGFTTGDIYEAFDRGLIVRKTSNHSMSYGIEGVVYSKAPRRLI